MEFKCKLCGYIASEEDYSSLIFRCPKCGVDRYHFEENVISEINKRINFGNDNVSVNRVLEKCINCGVCKRVCNKRLGFVNEGETCVNCGACILNCPTGALTPKYNYKEVFDEINNSEKVVVVFTAPSVRVGLGECFGLDYGENVEGKMVMALRDLGFNYVLDTTFGADVTVVEEVNELIDRVDNNGILPMFTSCCSSWVRYVELFYPEFLPNLSTTKSPNAIMGSLVKTYFSKYLNIDPRMIVTVGVVPCTSKKYEANRLDLVNNGLKNLDYIITTSELAIMINEKNIDFLSLENSDFDVLMGKGSSSGLIFGSSGGVMEASIRTLNYLKSGDNFGDDDINIKSVRGNEFLREASISISGKVYNVAVVYGLLNASNLLKSIKNGEKSYDFVEVMACDNGCVGGPGQKLHNINRLEEARNARMSHLFEFDKCSKLKFSHENMEVKKLYDEFFSSNENLAHELLHTKIKVKDKVNI